MGETLGEIGDVSNMKLDLDREQKLRTVALMMGIRYYTDTIIKDPEYLKTMIAHEENMKFSNDPEKEIWHLRPANVNSVIHCAAEFEQFLMGNRSRFTRIQIGEEVIDPADTARAQGEVEDTEATSR